MTYATQGDMVTRYGEDQLIELTDRADPPAGVIDAAIMAAALADADAKINAYISRRYTLPLAETPALLRQTAEAISYFILSRGRHSTQDREAYDDALKQLADLGTGAATLNIPTGEEPASSAARAAETGPGRVFSRDSLKGL
ncbi:MAG: DUF1320 domain-containing protein [Alphaproteobacteria bacterium]|nr:DUF1320 domain-containing protein [Alphaproteobacteria bacterium]